MFKVICINHHDHTVAHIPKIPIGDIVNVVEVKRFSSGIGYRIAGYECAVRPNGERIAAWYWEGNFSPLDGPCEQELHEQHVKKLTAEYVAKYGEPPIVELDPVAFARVWEGIAKALDKTGWE